MIRSRSRIVSVISNKTTTIVIYRHHQSEFIMQLPFNCTKEGYFKEQLVILGFTFFIAALNGVVFLFKANKLTPTRSNSQVVKYVIMDNIEIIRNSLVKLSGKIDELILSIDTEDSISSYESSIEDDTESNNEVKVDLSETVNLSPVDDHPVDDQPTGKSMEGNVERKLEEIGSVLEKVLLRLDDFNELTSKPITVNEPVSVNTKSSVEEIPEPLSLPLPGCNPYTMFPVVHDDIWKTYKSFQSSRWLSEEIILDKDLGHWAQLSEGERYFIKMVLGFFAASDGIVSANLAERFMSDTAWATVKAVYTEQMSIEQIHSETYSMLIDKYVTDPVEKNMLFNAIETLPAVQGKANWALKWVKDKSSSFAQRMIAFAIVEGIFFAGSFCAIFWLREKGVMPGLTLANSFIARDESSHTDFACLLYSKYIVNKLTFDEVKAMMVEAVDIEDKFINDSLPCKLLGMNSEAMSQYIRFMADRITVQLGYKPIFDVKNPFPFMARAGTHEIVNFFENRSSAYSLAVTSVADLNTQSINTESTDF